MLLPLAALVLSAAPAEPSPAAAALARGDSVVVFLDGDGPRKLRVQRFQRDRFVELGTIEGRADVAAISRDQAGLVVAWSDYATRVHVMRWDGRAWIRLGDPSGTGRFTVPAILSR